MRAILNFAIKLIGNLFSNFFIAFKVILIIILIAFIAFTAWISHAPREMEFAKPHLEKAIKNVFPTAKVNIENVKIAWLNFQEPPKVFANNVTIKTKNQTLNFAEIAGIIDTSTIQNKNPGLSKLNFSFNDLKNTTVQISGNLNEPKDEDTPVILDIEIRNFPLTAIKNYWPKDYGIKPYTWAVENIKGGIITYGKAKLNFTAKQIASGKVPNNAFKANLKLKNGKVQFIEGYELLKEINGNLSMTANTMSLDVKYASLGASKLTKGKMKIQKFSDPVQYMDLDVETKGSIKDLVNFYLYKKPSKPLVNSSENVEGDVTSRIKLYLPLIRELKAEEIKYSIESKLKNVNAYRVLDDYAISQITGDLNILSSTNYNANISGLCSIKDQHPINSFSPSIRQNRTLQSLPCNIDLNKAANDLTINSNLSLTSKELNILEAGIYKPKGIPAKLYVNANIDKYGDLTLDKINLKSEYGEILSSLRLYPGNKAVKEVKIDTMRFGRNDFSGKITFPKARTADSTLVEIKGRKIDATNFIKAQQGQGLAKSSRNNASSNSSSNYTIVADVNEVYYQRNKKLDNVNARLRLLNGNPSSGYINANVAGNPIKVSMQRVSASRKIKVSSPNAGAVLRNFGLYNNIVGGRLNIEGTYQNGELIGNATMNDFKIKGAPTIAKILNIASFTGISDTLSGSGISFDKAKTGFKLNTKESSLDNFVAYGGSIGITTTGFYNYEKNKIKFKGTLAPAYALNSIFGEIPIIGTALIGGEGEGLFAVNYKLHGTPEKPEISVNPLSALTPGFLRNIFD